jgi:hypothetical protein
MRMDRHRDDQAGVAEVLRDDMYLQVDPAMGGGRLAEVLQTPGLR